MAFREVCETAIAALEGFAEDARRRRSAVIRQPAMEDLARRLDLDRLIAEGGLQGGAFRDFLATYLDSSTRLHHPGCMAHQVAVPHPMGAVAALIDSFTNNAMAIYEMGPAAATVENAVTGWMLRKAGWDEGGGGVLTHGGSLANLTALVAARGRAVPGSWDEGNPGGLVIVASPGCHYSIARAAGIIGLGRGAVVPAPADALGRIEARGLAPLLAGLRREGRTVLAVVANAGSTALGLYDRLDEIAPVCREAGAWLHVDGAHGASALVSARRRHLLAGIEMADSLVWDAHKMLRAPTLCAAVLVRDRRDLDGAFREEASYLFHDKDQPGFDFIHRTVECTKAALGLKVFFALAAEGEGAIAAHIDRQSDLATAAAALLRAEPGIEVAAEPQSNIVCFRMDGDDALQLELRRRLTADGRFYVSTAEALGRRWLRLALMNPATEPADVAALVAEIRGLNRTETPPP